MIPKNELRIGSWVETMSTSNPYLQIKYGEHIDYCAVYDNPILLTPEVLEKCGFQPFQDGFITINGVGEYNYRMLITKQNRWQWTCNKSYCVKFDYLHELQNLYFALTGEELNIKL